MPNETKLILKSYIVVEYTILDFEMYIKGKVFERIAIDTRVKKQVNGIEENPQAEPNTQGTLFKINQSCKTKLTLFFTIKVLVQ